MTTATSPSQVKTLVRFDLSERIQHIIMMLSFTVMALTGLPQSFATAGWAKAWMGLFGGIAGIRKVHHIAAVLMAFVFFYHAIVVIADLFRKDAKRWMLPGKKDVTDAAQSVQYLLGKASEPPRYGRFDFRQKLEYWALIWGTVLMGVTGIMLIFPALFASFLPGDFIYAAKAAHGLEALLAVAAIVSWHMYHAHFAQGIFPLDKTIFTGEISIERMKEEHPLEYEAWLATQQITSEEQKDSEHKAESGSKSQEK